MARKSQHSVNKRLREQKKAEKARQKKARREARNEPDVPAEATDEPIRQA